MTANDLAFNASIYY